MKKSMVFTFLALSLVLGACGGNKNPFGSSDPFKDQPDDVKNGMLKPLPQAPQEKPIGKDVFVIDGEGFAEHIVLEQNANREVTLTARSFFDHSLFHLEISNLSDFKGATVTSTDGDSDAQQPATIKFKWTPGAEAVVEPVTVYTMNMLVYTTNLKNVYSYQKSFTVFVYRADYSAPEIMNIQKVVLPLKEGKSATFKVDVRDRDGLYYPIESRPTLMFMPKYIYYGANVSQYMSVDTVTQDPVDPSVFHFTVDVDLTNAEITNSSVTASFYVSAKSRFDKVSQPAASDMKVFTSLSKAMTTAPAAMSFKKGAVNHYEFQVFDPKSEGIVKMNPMYDCSSMPGSICSCSQDTNDVSIVRCVIDWTPAANYPLGTAAQLTYGSTTTNSSTADTEVVTQTFNINTTITQ